MLQRKVPFQTPMPITQAGKEFPFYAVFQENARWRNWVKNKVEEAKYYKLIQSLIYWSMLKWKTSSGASQSFQSWVIFVELVIFKKRKEMKIAADNKMYCLHLISISRTAWFQYRRVLWTFQSKKQERMRWHRWLCQKQPWLMAW